MNRLSARLPFRTFGLSVSLAMVFLSTGCVCTFERDWQTALRCGVLCDNLAGLWEGTWESEHNGHHGTLRAIITKCGDGRYQARYHATFAVLIPYAYDTTHSATEGDGVTHFCGEADLGCLAGGVYRTNGQANGRTFVARYRAEKDHGVYRMCRVGRCNGCVASYSAPQPDSPTASHSDSAPAPAPAPEPAPAHADDSVAPSPPSDALAPSPPGDAAGPLAEARRS